MRNILKILIATACMTVGLSSCDEHKEVESTTLKVGHIVCSDGTVVTLETCKEKGKTPVGVVFFVDVTEDAKVQGYAVSLRGCDNVAFADTIGTKQNTSADISAFDGNNNTFGIYSTKGITSSMAERVFNLWSYGQSAFVPSVAELKALYMVKPIVNYYIRQCGGVPLSDSPDEAWVWSSTEVYDQQTHKAWLFSLASGAILETPKNQNHNIRPIIAIY